MPDGTRDLLPVRAPAPAELIPLADLARAAADFAGAARSPSTLRAYASDWADFEAFCAKTRQVGLPAEPATVALYIAELATTGVRAATIARRLNTISVAHAAAGHPSPTRSREVREVHAGIRRTLGTAAKGKDALQVLDLALMIRQCPGGLLGTRDRAILLVGFAGAFRRSELVGLDVADLEFRAEGVTITLRRSKTDQEGKGRAVGLPRGRRRETCPVEALRAWLDAAGIAEGAVFRPLTRHGTVLSKRLSDRAVARIVQGYAVRSGLDPKRFAGHSLRSGHVTAAAEAGKSLPSIMAQTGHTSVEMVNRYIRRASLYRDNSADGIGL